MDWLESMNIRSLPEQQTRLSHHPNVGRVLTEEPNICLGFDACCFCAKIFDKKKSSSIVSCTRCQRVNYCSGECRLKDADPNILPYDVDESGDQDDTYDQTNNKDERRRSGYLDENSDVNDDVDNEGHTNNPSAGLVDVMMEPGGHSPTVCSLLKLCNIDEQVEHDNEDGTNGTSKTSEKTNKKECHHYHNNKKHNQLLQKQQEREAAVQRIVSELESYPATLANIVNEGPCFQKVFDQNPKMELLTIHIIGSSNGSEIWPNRDELVPTTSSETNIPQDAPPSLPSSSCLSGMVMPYTQAYTQALGDTLVDSHAHLKAIKLMFVGPDCPTLKKKPKVCKVTRRSSTTVVACNSSATGDSTAGAASKSITDPDPHGLLLSAGANAGHKRKRGMSFDRTKSAAVPDSPKIPSSPSPPPPPTCSYKGPPKQDPHKECKIVIDTYCSTYDEVINRQQKSIKTKDKNPNSNSTCHSPKHGSSGGTNGGDHHPTIMSSSSSSSSSSPTTNGYGITTTCTSTTTSSPDIVIMFNPGLTCPDYSWMETLDCIQPGTPFLVTTNTEMEALAELQFLYDNHYISSLPATAADIILHGSGSSSDHEGNEDDDTSSEEDDKDNKEVIATTSKTKKKNGGASTSSSSSSNDSSLMFFGENPYCGLRVRQSGTMANDLFVKNRWMYGGLWGGSEQKATSSNNGNGNESNATNSKDAVVNDNHKKKKKKRAKTDDSKASKRRKGSSNPALI